MKSALKMTLGALAFVAASAVSAAAATLSFVGTGQVQTNLKKNDLGLGLNGTDLDFISGDQKTTDNGLFLSGPAKLRFTYLGSEAGNTNIALSMASIIFTQASTVGDTADVFQAAGGLVDFVFETTFPNRNKGVFPNNGVANPASASYAIGYFLVSSREAIVLFDDIAAGDRDFDDFGMRIQVIPLPAGGVLLLGALGGLALLRRRKTA